MKKRYALAILGAAFLASVLMVTAVASHHEFLTTDSAYQIGGDSYSENYANYYWALATVDVYWKADSSIRDEVIDAISGWEAEYPGLSWQENTMSPEVTFVDEACASGTKTADFEHTMWFPDEAGDYWTHAEICIDGSESWPNSDEMVAALAHEIGHLHGLHERYNEGSQTCSSETTIMDTDDPSNPLTHCDSPITGPVTRDTLRVDEFYGGGQLLAWDHQVHQDGEYTVYWQELARAEYKHQMKFFYYDFGTSAWVEYAALNHTGDVGSSDELPISWVMSQRIDTSS